VNDQAVGMAVFVASFCLLVYLGRRVWTAVSPEFKRDLERLRERRRLRRAARRRG